MSRRGLGAPALANLRLCLGLSVVTFTFVKVSPCLVGTQILKSCYSTCHIECLLFVHGALNVDEKKKLIAQFGGKLRDKRFESN